MPMPVPLFRCHAAAALVLASLSSVACSSDTSDPRWSVRQWQLEARDTDGSSRPDGPVGAQIVTRDSNGKTVRVRIDGMGPDPQSPRGPLTLYEVSRLDEASGQWEPYCAPGPDGLARALALPGRWRADHRAFVESPEEFTLTCTSGANGKCARMGYLPGMMASNGQPLTPHFEACVRMMRADYCGDGRPNTVPGVPVEPLDRWGRQPSWNDPSQTFEAAWAPHGAVCVHRARDPNAVSLADVVERCPRLADRVGESCDESALLDVPGVLLLNRSKAPRLRYRALRADR